ncbi:hypothetical protein Acsp05_18850 [Actinokineospora sp. NBRC 105648]|nr:hypothetical protein Acsp05_18850 [Actinokineospora sp. NBRC 105648]
MLAQVRWGESQPSRSVIQFMALDDELDRIAAGADARLAFEARYPVAE